MTISRYLLQRYFQDHLSDTLRALTYVSAPTIAVVSALFWKLGMQSLSFKMQAKAFRELPNADTAISDRYIRFIQKNGLKQFLQQYVDDIPTYTQTQKFHDNPAELFEGNIIVLAAYREHSKGLILIKYSHYFPLFLKLFDAEIISGRYEILIEPGWSGYLDQDILSMQLLNASIYVEAPEAHDAKFLERNFQNLIPVPIGSNWWVDYARFNPKGEQRDVDVLMVSGWADFKRHHEFLKLIQPLCVKRPDIKVHLVGYPVGRDKSFIQSLVDYYGLTEHVILKEWLAPEQMIEEYNRCKVSVIWSKFEGINRAIVEGAFCGAPFILRNGFNFGENYDFVNSKTGVFAKPNELVARIESICQNVEAYEPNPWFMENQTYNQAIEIIAELLGDRVSSPIYPKINTLHGMKYLDELLMDRFSSDYLFIESCIRGKR